MYCQVPAGGRREPLCVHWALTSLQPSLTTSQNNRGWWMWGLLGVLIQRAIQTDLDVLSLVR